MPDEVQQPTNPDDFRTPGPGGGEQPALMLDTNRPITETQPTGQDNRFEGDIGSNAADTPTPVSRAAQLQRTRAMAAASFGMAVYILGEGSEVFNKAGVRAILRHPVVIALDGVGGDPRANDTKFAGFLHDSDTNWNLNIGQLDRKFNRATATPLPLMCERHGEDIEVEPYGAARQCPKCAEERLAQAAEIAVEPPPPPPMPDEAAERTYDSIEAGDVVQRTDIEDDKSMEVVSVHSGIAYCAWRDSEDLPHEQPFGLAVLRKVGTKNPTSNSEATIQAENERQAKREEEEELRRNSILPEG